MSENNITASDFAGKTVIVGLGVTGLSVVRFLVEKDIVPIVVDSRETPPGENELKEQFENVDYYFGGFDKDKLASAKQLIVSPGVPIKLPEIDYAQSQGVEIIGDIELFAREVKAPVIAITGSNGKSTVTTLVGDVFNECGWNVGVGGNIGVPALDLLKRDCDVYVLELSSFQLETLQSLMTVSAVVLNISEDHMDRYDSFNDYVLAKQNVYKNTKNSIVNRDDSLVVKMKTNENSIGFTLGVPDAGDFGLDDFEGQRWIVRNEERLINVTDIFMGGLHNIANVMAVLALVESFELPTESTYKAVKEFSGLPHRMQCVASSEDIKWFNDSKATNVGAAQAAISGLTGDVVLIAGGECKDADLSLLKSSVEKHVKHLILIGRDALLIEDACKGATDIVHASCMYDAVVKAKQLAVSGDNVLLSPACASFDMFKNYEHRGDVFVDAVKSVLS